MSWLFGARPPAPPAAPPPSDPNDASRTGSTNNKPSGIESSYRFDSAALERAAHAARDLEKSKFAKEAFDVTKQQEQTKQLEEQRRIQEVSLELERVKLDGHRIAQEERRRTLEEETRQQKLRAEYQDQLARKRYEDQLAQQNAMQEDQLRKQEESVKKQEAMRRSTMEYESDLRSKTDMKRIEAEAVARARADRDNHDLILEKLRLSAEEQRKTWLESIRTVGSVLGTGAKAYLSDWRNVTVTAGGVTLLAFGVYGAKHFTTLTARYLEARLGKPSLIRETSRITLFETLKHPLNTVKRWRSKPQDALSGIILKPDLEAHLHEIAIATRHTKRNRGYYRNMVLYGPPGTGKSMFAKSLAHHSGMDYAILTGGDVVPLGRDGVSAMHKVFDWSNASRRGLLLFVDEADAFLRKRDQERISEDLRATLNAFLYRTGEQSRSFMLVLASNQPEQFDWAINDRLDEVVHFGRPSLEERERMINHYFDLFILRPVAQFASRASLFSGFFRRRAGLKIDAKVDWSAKCSEVARATEGFSGREISKLLIAWQTGAYSSESGTLNEKIADEKLTDALIAHRKKVEWAATLTPEGMQHLRVVHSTQSEESVDQDTARKLAAVQQIVKTTTQLGESTVNGGPLQPRAFVPQYKQKSNESASSADASKPAK